MSNVSCLLCCIDGAACRSLYVHHLLVHPPRNDGTLQERKDQFLVSDERSTAKECLSRARGIRSILAQPLLNLQTATSQRTTDQN
jgi:hypothetical protein